MAMASAGHVHSSSKPSQRAQEEARQAVASKEEDRIADAFGQIDTDGSGTISGSELADLCALLGHAMTSVEIKQMLKVLDKDGDGTVTLSEFVDWWQSIAGQKGEYVGGMHMSNLKNIMPNPAAIFYHLFEDPQWFTSMGKAGVPFKFAAFAIAVVINLLILLSTFAFCFETMQEYSSDPLRNPENWQEWEDTWWLIEVVCVSMFTVDLMTRMVASFAASKHKEFFADVMNWIDFIAIFPFYVKLIDANFVDLRFFRVIRLARVLRSIPSPRYQGVGKVVADIIIAAAAPLFVPIFFMLLACIILSTLAFYAEATYKYTCELPDGTKILDWNSKQGTEGNEGCLDEVGCPCAGTLWHIGLDGVEREAATFASIPDAFWWCIVTFLTVGYGDVNPISPIGKGVATATMVIGIFFLAMPLAITGAAFVDAWKKLDERAKLIEEEVARRKNGESSASVFNKERVDDAYQNLLQCVANMSAAESSIDALMASAATEARAEDLVDHSEMDYDSLKAQISGVLGALNACVTKAETGFLDRMPADVIAGERESEKSDPSADLGSSGTDVSHVNPLTAVSLTDEE